MGAGLAYAAGHRGGTPRRLSLPASPLPFAVLASISPSSLRPGSGEGAGDPEGALRAGGQYTRWEQRKNFLQIPGPAPAPPTQPPSVLQPLLGQPCGRAAVLGLPGIWNPRFRVPPFTLFNRNGEKAL